MPGMGQLAYIDYLRPTKRPRVLIRPMVLSALACLLGLLWFMNGGILVRSGTGEYHESQWWGFLQYAGWTRTTAGVTTLIDPFALLCSFGFSCLILAGVVRCVRPCKS